MNNQTESQFAKFIILDIFISLGVVIPLLFTFNYLSLEQYKIKALMTQALASSEPTRKAALIYQNIHGEWPQDIEETRQYSPYTTADSLKNSPVANITLGKNGAVHFTFVTPMRVLHNKTITFHSVVPENDPLGPVRNIAGNSKVPGWTAPQDDRTQVPEGLIQSMQWN